MTTATAQKTIGQLLVPETVKDFRTYLRGVPVTLSVGDQSTTWDNPLARWMGDIFDLDVSVYTHVVQDKEGTQYPLAPWMTEFQVELAARIPRDRVSADDCLHALGAFMVDQ